MSGLDYIQFTERLLVAVADEQEPPGLGELNVEDVCRRHRIPFQETWVHLVGMDLEAQGFGSDRSTLQHRRFLINGAGLRRASELRREKLPKSISDHLTSEKAQKLINFGNFVLAVIALVVAAIALSKTGN